MSDEVFSNEGDVPAFSTVGGSLWTYSASAKHGAFELATVSSFSQHGYTTRYRKGRLTATFHGEPTTIMTPDGVVDFLDGEAIGLDITEGGVSAWLL